MLKEFVQIHHEWTSPVSLIAIYCHPLEHVLVNLMGVYFGAFSYICFYGVFICYGIRSITTCDALVYDASIHHYCYLGYNGRTLRIPLATAKIAKVKYEELYCA